MPGSAGASRAAAGRVADVGEARRRPARARAAAPDLRVLADLRLSDAVRSLRWSPTGTSLAVASQGGEVVRLGDGDPVVVARHAGGALCAEWSPDGTLLATGGQDGRARIVRTDDGRAVAVLDFGRAWVAAVRWSHDGSRLAVAAGREVRVTSPDGVPAAAFADHRSTVADIAWIGSTGRIATACYGGVCVLEPGRSAPAAQFPWKGSLLSIDASPDGEWIAAGCQDASIHVWRVADGEDFEMAGFPMKVRPVAFSPDSRSLAAAGGNEVTLWDFSPPGPAGRGPRVLRGAGSPTSAVTCGRGRTGPVVWGTSLDGRLRAWVAGTDASPAIERDLGEPAEALALARDGSRVAAGGRRGRVVAFGIA